MAELSAVFEMVTTQVEPYQNSWGQLEQRRRRSARNRKAAALAMVAVIMAAIALFAATAINRGKEGSAPAVPQGDSVPTFTMVGLDGSVRSTLPGFPGAATPDVSPDGTMVAFTIADRTVPQVATMRIDGTEFRILTNDPIAANAPRWSPDGSQLAYFRVDREGNLRLMVMNADGTNVREIPGTHQTGSFNPPDWSPDGSLILYTSFHDGLPILATLPVAGDRTHFLNKGTGWPEVGGAWSPDGSTIAFTRGVGIRKGVLVFEVWAMNADGSGEHRLAALQGASAEAPAWSPDGTKVAFIGTEGGIYRGNGVLYVVDVATGEVTELLRGTATGRRHENRPNWLPDGDTLLVMTEAP
ncbi:MAG: TolB family protein [Actinomycetota bacterium]